MLVSNINSKNIKKKPISISILLILIICSIWIAYDNTALELNEYSISNEKLPEAFNGYRIAYVSDLHNAEIGEENERLLDVLRAAGPDIIAITGDIIDSCNTNLEIALEFVKEAMQFHKEQQI
uniref:metallophosphoesterase n=1 Tax=Agathobacter sp. TaxID=2021311 RepID=UPI004057882A